MQYYDAQPGEDQRKPLEPKSIISGALPGATQIRIGGNQNILIDGLHQRVSVNTSGGNISVGVQSDGTVNLTLNDGVNNVLRLGNAGGGNTGLVFNDSANDRIFIGKNSTGNYVAKLSQSGRDVKTATNDQLIWSSDFNSFKIVATATVPITVPDPFTPGSSPLTKTIAHGLSFTPVALGYVSIPAGAGVVGAGVLTNLPAMVGGSGSISAFAQIAADATNIYLYVRNNTASNLVGAPFGTDWTFRYYILQETAATT